MVCLTISLLSIETLKQGSLIQYLVHTAMNLEIYHPEMNKHVL